MLFLWLPGALLGQPVAPTITTQPQTQVVTAGANVAFTVVASGDPAPTYQWRKNGSAIAGATDATLTIDNVQFASAARYDVIVTNTAGTVTSGEAKLYVGQAGGVYRLTSPVAESSDISAAVQAQFGNNARVADWNEIKADYGGNLAAFYQMVGLADGFEAMGTLDGNRLSYNSWDGHRQYFIQRFDTGPYGGFGAHAQTGSLYLGSWYGFTMPVIAIIGTPVITAQPQSQVVTAGATAVFSVVATGDPAPGYQWRKNGVAIDGATAATLTIDNAQFANSAIYDVVVTNPVRAVVSSQAVLYVGQAGAHYRLTTPVALGTDINATVQAQYGSTARVASWDEITADFGGNTAAFFESIGLPDSSSALVTTLGGSSFYNFYYGETYHYNIRRQDTGIPAGEDFGHDGTLFLRASSSGVRPIVAIIGAPAITTQPLTQVVTAGANAVFTVTATGDPAPTYQWRKNGVAIPGATNATLAITSAQFADSARYDVSVGNSVRAITSDVVKLYVGQPGSTYRLTTPVAETSDINSVVRAQFGSGAQVADWDEIKATYAGNLAAFYQMLGLADGWEAMVLRASSRFYNDGNRQYFLQRFDAGPPGGFLAHDQSNTAYLGSWNGFSMPVIAKITTNEVYQVDTVNFDTAGIPVGWTASPLNSGNLDYNQQMYAGWNSTNRISRPIDLPSGTPQLEITFRASLASGYFDYNTGSYVILTDTNGRELKLQHAYFGADVFWDGVSLHHKDFNGPPGQFRYTILVKDAQVTHRGVLWDGTTLFDYTVTVPGLLLANIVQLDLAVFTGETAEGTLLDDAAITIIGSGLAVAPSFTLQPQNQKNVVGDNVTFTVAATGGPSPSFQWQVSADGGQTWANVVNDAFYSGGTTASLTITGVTNGMDGNRYRALASNAVQGNVASRAATLSVALNYAFATVAGTAGNQGSTDGTGSAAQFYYPAGLGIDAAGSVFIGDHVFGKIRNLRGDVVTTFATGQSNPDGLAIDGAGNIYVANYGNHTIQKITSAGVVTTLAGDGSIGSVDGVGTAARFNHPSGVAVDSSGNVYVADQWNHTIRKITSGGVVTTLAGSAGSYGSADGAGSAARFTYPYDVAVDGAGSVYVADTSNHTIRKISGGVVTTFAGSAGSTGASDGQGGAARFNQPWGIGTDNKGNIYVAERANHLIRKITSSGAVSTVAGSAGSAGAVDGIGNAVRFNYPKDVVVDSAGNIYVADMYNNTIRVGSPAAPLLTSATTASGIVGSLFNYAVTFSGAITGFGASGLPDGLSLDHSTGVISGIPTTAGSFNVMLTAKNGAGNGSQTLVLSIAPGVQLITFGALAERNYGDDPVGLSATSSSGLPVNFSVVSGPANISGSTLTITGTGTVVVRASQDGNANYLAATPVDRSLAISGNPKAVVRGLNTVIASGDTIPGLADGTDFGPATLGFVGTDVIHYFSITNTGPLALNLTGAPKISISGTATADFSVTTLPASPVAMGGGTTDFGIKFSPAATGARTATVTIASDDPANPVYAFAIQGTGMEPAPTMRVTGTGGALIGHGDTTPSTSDGTSFGTASQGLPATDIVHVFTIINAGTLPLALTGTPKVGISGEHASDFSATVQPSATVDAAGGTTQFSIKFSPAGSGVRNAILSIACNDPERAIYTFAISGIGITPAYTFSTLAGAAGGWGANNGTVGEARFNGPQGVAVDDEGNVYVSDFNHLIRKITNVQDVTTLAGGGGMFYADGIGTAAGFQWPGGLAVDAAGNVFVADSGSNTIRKVTAAGVVTTLAGKGGNSGPFSGGFADGFGTAAEFRWPSDVALRANGDIIVADTDNGVIRKLSSDGMVITLPQNIGAGRVAVDANGNIYVTNYNTGAISKIQNDGFVTTLASASIPAGIAVDSTGNVYVADRGNHTILKISPDGVKHTIGGLADNAGSADGMGSSARFDKPWGLAVDRAGNVYVTDYNNHTVRWGAVAPPDMTSEPVASGTVGQPMAFTVTFARALTGFLASGLPNGLSLNTTTGVIAGTPGIAGTFPVTLSARNGAGIGTGILTLSIASVDSTLITPASKSLGASGESYTIDVTSVTTWSVLSNQPWATVSTGSGSGNGTVSVTAEANTAPGSRSATITIGGQVHTLTQSGMVNNAPTISDIPNQSIVANTNTGALAFTVGDAEMPAGNLIVSYSSSNPTLVPNTNIVVAGIGAKRTVTVTPAAQQSGTAIITVTVSDGTLSTSDTFTLVVNAVGGDYWPAGTWTGTLSGTDVTLVIGGSAAQPTGTIHFAGLSLENLGYSRYDALDDSYWFLRVSDNAEIKIYRDQSNQAYFDYIEGQPPARTVPLQLVATPGNLLANGSFETGTSGNYVALSAGDGGLAPWVVSAGGIEITTNASGGPAQEGTRHIDLDGFYVAGTIQQGFSSVAGSHYLLSFYITANDGTTPTVKQVEVQVGDQTQIFSYDLSGGNRWVRCELPFTALTSSETLVVRSLSAADSAHGALLDNFVILPAAQNSVAPSFTSQPGSQSILAGENASFAVAASGTPAPLLQWQVSTDGGSGWSNINNGGVYSGAITATLLISSATIDMNGYAFRVLASNTAASNVASNSGTLTVRASITGWMAAKFTESERANPSISGPNAVYGHDGLSNLVKYALGLEPKQDITTGLPDVSTTATDWVYTYTRPSDTTDVTYAVEVSTNLTTWTTVGVTHERASTGAGTETWRGRYPLASASSVYFRLKVTH